MPKYFSKKPIAVLLFISFFQFSNAQFTKQDSLRGSNGPARTWWDVKQYTLNVDVDIANKTISGSNQITFEVVQAGKNKIMQIDLQMPMEIETVEDMTNNIVKSIPFKREGNVYWLDFGDKQFDLSSGKNQYIIRISFKGKPREAVNPPWDGGWVWTRDAKGRPWVTVACQGLGASVWYPCKDYQGDEPEEGAIIGIKVPDTLVAVANGTAFQPAPSEGKMVYGWRVRNPINNYNIVPYIGKYVKWNETFSGEKGPLTCEYWVLDYNLEKSKQHFRKDVRTMLKCFENWFGPYPFYDDHFKLVDAPHLGMEHQSAIAYGNQYKNGYLGSDLSGTGWGDHWDYIIVHEAGHEWFGNNITTVDIADMWVHEGFTDYSEALFVEFLYGKKAAGEYVQGLRNNIQNDKPIIGPYGVNEEGSGDMYFKGANMIHTIRQVINNDKTFRNILRGLNIDFYHQTVTSAQVEKYMIQKSGKDLSKIFDQYLRTANIPALEWKRENTKISYRWVDCVPGFNMPVKLSNGIWLNPVSSWKTIDTKKTGGDIKADANFYIKVRKL